MRDQHTPEPWKLRDIDGSIAGIDDMDDNSIAQTHQRVNDTSTHTVRLANARRIVACVNASAGLNTAYLENNVERYWDYWNVRVQLDMLMEAAEKSLNWLSSYPGGGAKKMYEEMRDVIDAVKARDDKEAQEQS